MHVDDNAEQMVRNREITQVARDEDEGLIRHRDCCIDLPSDPIRAFIQSVPLNNVSCGNPLPLDPD